MRGQASFEYIAVTALILLMIVPATYLFYNYSLTSEAQIVEKRIAKVGRDIVNTAEMVYYMGEPAMIVIDEQMPGGVINISVIKDWGVGINELVFYTMFSGELSEHVFVSRVNINGSFDASAMSAGVKHIRIEAKSGVQPFVLINFT
ncbi:TPA: hypothetical protein HA317_00350 [Candidatus Woesearchaeota archaeon]|nr:hypothetical protein [Candidatus Woesearchaeota archaeon]